MRINKFRTIWVPLLNHLLCFGKQRGVLKMILAMLLLTAVTVYGADWGLVQGITVGHKIELRTRDGAELKGTFISATAESIAIRYASGEQSVDRANVLRVRVYDSGRRVKRGALATAVGAGAGLGFGFLVCPQCANEGAGGKYIVPAVGIGAGSGAALGFMSSSYETIYKVK